MVHMCRTVRCTQEYAARGDLFHVLRHLGGRMTELQVGGGSCEVAVGGCGQLGAAGANRVRLSSCEQPETALRPHDGAAGSCR